MSEKPQFDVFLCHNSADKLDVKKVALQLKNFDLALWLDEWEIPPGRSSRRLLEAQIEETPCAAVFVGENGIGPWEAEEISAFLYELVERGCPIIPVLLLSAPQKPALPPFLKDKAWVDFRRQNPDPVGELFWGITGQKLNEYLHNKLTTLLKQKDDLEIEIQGVQQKLNDVEALRSNPDQNLQIFLDWLYSLKEGRIEEYANIILKRFPDLRDEVTKEKNLCRFYLEICCYLDYIRLSIERDNAIFIDEPALAPTLADCEIYKSACFDIYRDIFNFIKERIPERVEPTIRSKLGANIDTFLERLLVYA